MSEIRDTYRYKLIYGYTVVYIGITNDIKRREDEHRNEGFIFSRIETFGPAVSRKTAEKWEEEELAKYRQFNNGRNPKYNKTSK